jgi:hypothetical protein
VSSSIIDKYIFENSPYCKPLRFNLATLLPLILGAIIIISKKAAFLSKLALFISGFFGLGGLSSFGGGGYGGGYYPGGGYGYQGGGYHDPSIYHQQHGVYKVLESNTPRTQEEILDHFYDYDKKHLLKDRSSRLYERDSVDKENQFKYKPTNQRSFVWAPSNPNPLA